LSRLQGTCARIQLAGRGKRHRVFRSRFDQGTRPRREWTMECNRARGSIRLMRVVAGVGIALAGTWSCDVVEQLEPGTCTYTFECQVGEVCQEGRCVPASQLVGEGGAGDGEPGAGGSGGETGTGGAGGQGGAGGAGGEPEPHVGPLPRGGHPLASQ